eukprot:10911402-Prorocentrum_lima.AAC.1
MHGYPMTNLQAPRNLAMWNWDRYLYYWERVPPCSYEYLSNLVPLHIRKWLAKNTNHSLEDA